jgi:hypothetical protein
MQVNAVTFFRQGDDFMLGTDNPAQRYDELPPATYLLRVDMMRGFYLELTEDFELPKKLYGNLVPKADRILNTFAQRPGTTGVLLEGEKGSGKTLLTKLISTKGRENGIPTIIVNFSAHGDMFNTFIQKIQQPTIILFDEFEKVYDKDGQQELLTLLDGVFASKKLFLLTSNDYNAIDTHMKNRPGRIYYALKFDGLEPSFIMEYAEDNLKNKKHLQNLGVLSGFIRPMNFDMLQAVVEESNRYDQPPMETLDMLNVRVMGYLDYFYYELTVTGKEFLNPPKLNKKASDLLGVDKSELAETRCNPLNSVDIDYYYVNNPKRKAGTDAKYEYNRMTFSPSELVTMDGITGKYEYKKADGSTLKLSRKPLEATGFQKVTHLVDVL